MACLFYFTFLVILSLFDEVDIIIFGVFIELLTIPFLLLLIFLIFITVENNIKNKFNIHSNHFFSFLLLVSTIIILAIASIYN